MAPERFSVYLTETNAEGIHEILNCILPYPIDFAGRDYECALAEAFLDISWQNIVDGQFSYSIDGGKEWQHTLIPQGRYTNLNDFLDWKWAQSLSLCKRASAQTLL